MPRTKVNGKPMWPKEYSKVCPFTQHSLKTGDLALAYQHKHPNEHMDLTDIARRLGVPKETVQDIVVCNCPLSFKFSEREHQVKVEEREWEDWKRCVLLPFPNNSQKP